MILPDPLKVVVLLVRILDELSIDYLLGGSLASSIHGIPRSSQDVDLAVILDPPAVDALVEALKTDFYVDAEAVRDAVKRKRAFNIIHLKTMFKVDIFVRERTELTGELFLRRQSEEIVDGKQVYVYSPEDIILEKLDWYRKGDGTSDRQWQDILGVLKVQGRRLDLTYLNSRAESRGLHRLFLQALDQAGLAGLSGVPMGDI
ncbi:MAG: nucleotidyl transferase AbiEii/AbiGii toxin family protein [Candidatus Euphemobacter frigidus]|nr:nucleotidyl transferase AbiEii/AbiGii toxin family protein [Candidatus Euphemobacter frigidus]MDP8276679.1 nucleotidyl transferase AbiEii/AbiGii toxin family protein [Candidatus Euphemobacter frigidus]